MPSSNNFEIVSKAHPHTVKKFELIEAYAEAWARKLLEYGRNTGNCNGIVFIDCMCNSGVYVDENNKQVFGTPIRVAKKIASIMREANYQRQQAWLYFNDLEPKKIEELKKHLPGDTKNFHIVTSSRDGNDLLREIGAKLRPGLKMNYLLVYDPYTASIDWEALLPFISNWGEVILNHMVSDSIRAVSQVKKPKSISKYEQTYLSSIEELLTFGSDRNAFERRTQDIIRILRGGKYYIASYPFFNTRNSLVYNLLHCTGNLEGFKLYKSTAWKTFGNKSSLRKPSIDPAQLTMLFDDQSSFGLLTTHTDDDCYFVQDIVKFVYATFKGRTDVPLTEIWDTVNEHPVFPSDLFKNEIKDQLKTDYGCTKHRSSIDFT